MTGEGTVPGGQDYPDREWQKRPIEDPLDEIDAAERAESPAGDVAQKDPRFADAPPNEPWENEPTDAELQEREGT